MRPPDRSSTVCMTSEELARLDADDPEPHPEDPRPAVVLPGRRLHAGDPWDPVGEVPVVEGRPAADHAGPHEVSSHDVGVLSPGATGAGLEWHDEVRPLLNALQPALVDESSRRVPGCLALGKRPARPERLTRMVIWPARSGLPTSARSRHSSSSSGMSLKLIARGYFAALSDRRELICKSMLAYRRSCGHLSRDR